MAGPITPVEPRPFVSQTVTLADSTTVMELDPQPFSNTKELILYNLSTTEGLLVKVGDLGGEVAGAEVNFDNTTNYDGYPGPMGSNSLGYYDVSTATNVSLIQVLRDGVPRAAVSPPGFGPYPGDSLTIDAPGMLTTIGGTAGNNLAGSTIFTDATVNAFLGVGVGWTLYIDADSTPYQIAYVDAVAGMIVVSTAIPTATVNDNWIAVPGGPAVFGGNGANNTASVVFTDLTPDAFKYVAAGWKLRIQGLATEFTIASVDTYNQVTLTAPIPPSHLSINWVSYGVLGSVTLTADANAIKRTGTNGENAAGSFTFTDLSANFLAAPAVSPGDSLYIDAVPYVIMTVAATVLTLQQPIVEEHSILVGYAAYQINKQYTFSAPTPAVAIIEVLTSPVTPGTTLTFTRPQGTSDYPRPDILLIAQGAAPTQAYLPPTSTTPGIAYFDGSGTVNQIGRSIMRALANIPNLTFTVPTQGLMPLGRPYNVTTAAAKFQIYGINQAGAMGVLDGVFAPYSARTITSSAPAEIAVVQQFSGATDTNVWPDSPNNVRTELANQPNDIRNIIWNVYKAIVDPGNGLLPYIRAALPSNIFNGNVLNTDAKRNITLVSRYAGTNGNFYRATGFSPPPPSPPPSSGRIYVNSESTGDPEFFAGGEYFLPSAANVDLASSVYVPASSAITLSIGSEGNRQPLASTQFWAANSGSNYGVVLRCASGENVQCNVTFIQNRGYSDGV